MKSVVAKIHYVGWNEKGYYALEKHTEWTLLTRGGVIATGCSNPIRVDMKWTMEVTASNKTLKTTLRRGYCLRKNRYLKIARVIKPEKQTRLNISKFYVKVKLSRYTPWRRMGWEEV
jgi:CRISPR/Cas system Type II protein with McrA/HNH and RuvC-like nuclease domain